MDTRITARHFSATPKLKDHVNMRLTKLERFYNGITDAHVVLSVPNTAGLSKSAEITVQVYRQSLTAQDRASTFEEAVDRCVLRLRRQVLKYKDKIRGS
ncbi:MAG: ribosome-associated translation inhibitor RaiA [Rhodothermales bacterium]